MNVSIKLQPLKERNGLVHINLMRVSRGFQASRAFEGEFLKTIIIGAVCREITKWILRAPVTSCRNSRWNSLFFGISRIKIASNKYFIDEELVATLSISRIYSFFKPLNSEGVIKQLFIIMYALPSIMNLIKRGVWYP